MAPELDSCKRILIIKLSSIGDVVMTTPVAKALRNALPNVYIAWVVEDKARDVLTGNPYLDEVIVWNRRAFTGSAWTKLVGILADLLKLGPELRARKFDIAIDLQGLLRSALVAWVSGAPWRLGYDNAREGGAMFYNLRATGQRRVRGPQQYLNMLEALNIFSQDLDMYMPIQDDDRAFAQHLVADAVGHATDRRIAALCPATTWPQKHWTVEGWARLADALISDHNVLPVFLGSAADVGLVNEISSLMQFQAVSAVGKTTLKQAAAIIEQCQLTIAVDTGLMHIAMALNRPTVGIFGPTRWQHLAEKDNFTVVAKGLACMPCMRHPTCKRFDCMRAITAEDVLSAADSWLARKATT